MKTKGEIGKFISEDIAIERKTRYKIAEFLRKLAYYLDPKDVRLVPSSERVNSDMCYHGSYRCCMLLKGHRGRHRV